jgi:hypothetical protein
MEHVGCGGVAIVVWQGVWGSLYTSLKWVVGERDVRSTELCENAAMVSWYSRDQVVQYLPEGAVGPVRFIF